MRNVWESLMISEASSLRKGTSTQMRSKTQLMDSTQSKYCKMHFFLMMCCETTLPNRVIKSSFLLGKVAINGMM